MTEHRLYDRRRDERDACGIGFVADVHGRPSRAVLDAALAGLERLRHRGAVAADARTGDGAGVLVPLPEGLFAGPESSKPGRLGVAMAFLPRSPEEAKEARRLVEQALVAEGLELLRWRLVPVDHDALGELAKATAPAIEQAVFAVDTDSEDAERRCFRAGRRAVLAARQAGVGLYLASCSTRTVTYKALCAADQLAAFYPDLADPAFAVGFAVFHQRYSTNTAPSWERAQPFRFLCHNGEINTLDGNVAWMRAREGHLGAGELDEDLLRPVLDPGGSDSAKLDNAVELLVRGGRDLRHALAMLVPAVEPDADDHRRQDLRDFYRYHACLTEPWDGPAGLVFTDGRLVGAALDRNGLRPMRWEACEDGLVVCASEAGAVDTGGRGRVRRGRLGPGQMLCVDPERGLLTDDQIKGELAASRPWSQWVAEHLRRVEPGRPVDPPADDRELVAAQATFGFTRELVSTVLRPMATAGREPTASMGDDTPPAVLGTTTRPVGHFLRQRFAQVTNPPIDHLRERHVLSSRTLLGCRHPLLGEEPEAARLVELAGFVLTPDGLESLGDPALGLCPRVLDATWPVEDGPGGLRAACLRLGEEAVAAVRDGACLLVISDAAADELPEAVPVPSLLAVGATQQRLLREGLATRTSVVADTGEPVDSHQAAALLGYGADAIYPRLTLAAVASLDQDPAAAQDRYRDALTEGVFKVMSKMGISVLDAYRGAQIFEAVGLDEEVVDLCFAGTPSPLGGIGRG